ncbi:hypothetical protein ACFL2V_13755 [Pseudomonadota bacterium]
MEELIYTISDIEMGRRDIMDDFSGDQDIVSFVGQIGSIQGDPRVTLILNGDIFDFLKMSHMGNYPRHITEEISMWKLSEVIENHKDVFKALRNFVANPRHSIFFIIGNHDADLAWPSLQNKIKQELEHGSRVRFNYVFQNDEVHIEHGHLIDPFFAINPLKPILGFRGEQILNLPWGAEASFSHLVKIKEEFPKEEQLYPKPLALKQNPEFKKASNNIKLKLLLRKLIIEPLTHPFDPAYRTPYIKFFKHFLKFGLDVLDDERFIGSRFKALIKRSPGKRVYIMGHSHVLDSRNIGDQKCFVTDTWRNEYDITKGGEQKRKSFAEIKMSDGKVGEATLKVL